MDLPTLVTLVIGFALVAALYGSVGHAGASGYLALMALAAVSPAVMRPTALVLNLVAAAIATWRFSRAGLTSGRPLFWFATGSVPLAFLGGSIALPVPGYRRLLGGVLLASAAILAWRAWNNPAATHGPEPPIDLPVPAAVAIGATIGLLSGLTGTGGGIFLSPLLLLAGWAGPRRTAGLVAPFILMNSGAGLVGLGVSGAALPAEMGWLVAAVLVGALAGTRLGTHRLPARALVALLALVLLVASFKLLATS